MKRFNRNKLSLLISATLLSSTAAIAQETEQQGNPNVKDKEHEVIEIIGIRASLRENLNNKRYSDSVVDSINTEDIAKNPDKNMAEALQRIPGVQIEREFGEGSKVSIRGTDPALTNTLVNGQSAKSAEYLPGRGESNAFDFSNIPAERVSKIEVHKSARADLDAGGIGGTVIMHTKKPLEQKDGYGYFNFESEYNDNSEQYSPQLSTAYNFKNESETFGASIAVSLQRRNSFRTGFESSGVAGGTNAVSTGFTSTDAIICPTEACNATDIKLRDMNGHNEIINRHMAFNGFTYGQQEFVAGGTGSYPNSDDGSIAPWNNATGYYAMPNDIIDPTYIDSIWGLFRPHIREAGFGQTPGKVLGSSVRSPARASEDERLDTTINLQWAPTDELSFNLELNRNTSDRDNKDDNLSAQAFRLAQYLYSNNETGIDPRLVMDHEADVVTSLVGPIDGAYLVGYTGAVWDGSFDDTSVVRHAKWGEIIRRSSEDRTGSKTEQDRVHLTVDYLGDSVEAKFQIGRTSANSSAFVSETLLGTRYGDYLSPYSGDQNDVQIPTYNGVNLGYGYDLDSDKVYWGVQADPSLTGDELTAAQQRASSFLLAPTNEFYVMDIGNSKRFRENTEDFAQGDFTILLDNDFYITSVKFGAKYRDINRTQNYLSEEYRFHNFADQSSEFPTILAGELASGTVSGIDTAGHDIPDEYFDINLGNLTSLVDDHFLLLPSDGTPNRDLCIDAIAASDAPTPSLRGYETRGKYYGCRSGFNESFFDRYNNNEEIFAYYGMVNFGGDDFSGNIGVRVVDTKRESMLWDTKKDENGVEVRYTDDPTADNYIAELSGFRQYEAITQESSTKDVLPSFNIKYNLTDNLILRAAASKNISHPSLAEQSSRFYVATERARLLVGQPQDMALVSDGAGGYTETDRTERLFHEDQRRASVGNPDLGSYTSINSEVGLEWYFDDSSIFAVTAFQKDISNIVRASSEVQNLDYLGEQGQKDNNGYDIFGNYVVSSYFNTADQKVQGLEMQLQHEFGYGFGGVINYTYTDVPGQNYSSTQFTYVLDESGTPEYRDSDPSKRPYYEVTGFNTKTTTQVEPMYGQSKDTLNASLYFENETFSARLSYNYRSEFAIGSDTNGLRFTDARQQLDFKATYQISDNLMANFAVTNLTDENVVQYHDSSQIVQAPVIHKAKWIDEMDANGNPTGNRVIATDQNGVEIIEESITGDAAYQMLADAIGTDANGENLVTINDLKPYYENRVTKMVYNEYTNGRRFYLGLNWTF
ncbi:MAG: TonB-dependent receptor [Gammaproteobacteria bacterium]|nr:TonB-dependent receptor [Gammaproteobacteria bacterium]